MADEVIAACSECGRGFNTLAREGEVCCSSLYGRIFRLPSPQPSEPACPEQWARWARVRWRVWLDEPQMLAYLNRVIDGAVS